MSTTIGNITISLVRSRPNGEKCLKIEQKYGGYVHVPTEDARMIAHVLIGYADDKPEVLTPIDGGITAPVGIELSMMMYLTSDTMGADVKLTIGGLPKLMPFSDKFNPMGLLRLKMPEIMTVADDFRLMTRDEIREYKANEDEDDE